MNKNMRDYGGTRLEVEQWNGVWLWRVTIPAWTTDGGLKASAARPSGQARSRRRAMKQAREAVRAQEDDRQVERHIWDKIGETWV